MENGFLATLSSRGQLTLPKEIRKKLHLEKGGTVLCEQSGKAVMLRPVTMMPVDDDFDEKEWEALTKLARETKGRTYKTMKSLLKSLK